MSVTKGITYFILAIVLLLVARHVMVLCHEWTHGTVAWISGYKDSPFAIYYGDWTLLHVDEDVDYGRIMADGKGWLVSLIASSALVTNTLLFLLSTFLLSGCSARWPWPARLFVFWFGVVNIAELFSYVPMRVFFSGDIRNFVTGLNISPWLVLVPGTILVGFGLSRVFGHDLPLVIRTTGLSGRVWQRLFLGVLMFAVFWFYGGGLDAFFPWENSPGFQAWVTFSAVLGVAMYFVCDRYCLRPPYGWDNGLWLKKVPRCRS
ncbi:MAG: hypothetical protein AB1597_02060 [Chloroflexota bacterium]